MRVRCEADNGAKNVLTLNLTRTFTKSDKNYINDQTLLRIIKLLYKRTTTRLKLKI